MRECYSPISPSPDARGGGVLCFCATDAGVPSEGTVQTQHGWAGSLHLPVWISAAGKEEAESLQCASCPQSGSIIFRLYLQCISSSSGTHWVIWGFKTALFLLPQEQLPELNVHFRSQSFHTSMYASSWFLTLFLTFLPLPVATRIFDIFMYEVGNILSAWWWLYVQCSRTSCNNA